MPCWCSGLPAQVLPEQTRFSTHDSTVPPGPPGFVGTDFGEVWADVKTPGDGWAYSVGTIEVRDTGVGGPVLFSGAPANLPAASMAAFLTGTAQNSPDRQIVMLQQAGVADDIIGFQRFFYGSNPTAGTNVFRASNARAISVWPASDPLEMRLAICGETFDELLPESNVPGGWQGAGVVGPAGALATAGFVAVFNGRGDLLWSHQFFGQVGRSAVRHHRRQRARGRGRVRRAHRLRYLLRAVELWQSVTQ